MSAGKPTQAGGRERLLDACDALFSASSYSEVGVAAILDAAKVQAPTLYHHFGDKEGLFVAWAERAFRALGDNLKNSGASSFPALAVALWTSLNFDVAQTVRDSSLLTRGDSKEKLVTAYFEAVYEPFVAELVRKISAGEMQAEPVGRLVDAFLGGLLALKRQNAQDAGEIAAWWANIFERGLSAGESATAYA